ncbi:MAG: S46 family peptidase [Prolixibacteraceae bacterium]
MKYFKVLILVLALTLALMVQADEGMWLPSLLNKVNVDKMHEMGAELSAEEIYNINTSSLKDAVIVLDRGSCTGEMVSDQGLFLTNHHCGYGEIQKHSTEENNILRDGFWAKTQEEELSNPGKVVSFLIRVEDVSDKVLAQVTDDMSESQREDSINKVSNQLIDEAIKDTPYDAKVKSIYRENQYLLFVYETFKDVRLVATPPHFIGKFGGDTDNWMWPRHTGDFSMFRVYTGPDGKPAEYSAENIPLKPKYHFPVSLKGYQKDDFAMVMGYPGSTNRYLTAKGVQNTMEITNNTRINVRKTKLDIMKVYMATSDLATIQYASKKARSSNYYKYSIGQNRGLKNLNVVAKKQTIEDEFEAWANQTEERKAKYGNALTLINDAYSNTDENKAIAYIDEALLRGPEIFGMAHSYEVLSSHLLKNAEEDVIQSDVENLKNKMEPIFRDFNAETDQLIVAELTKIFVENVQPEYYPGFISTIQKKYKGDYSKWAAGLFKKSFMDDEAAVANFLAHPKGSVLEKDPVLKAVREIYEMKSKAGNADKKDKEALELGYRLFLDGLMQMNSGNVFYPDANSTMRLTYGSVGDYVPRDGVQYSYYTTLQGYIEKEIPGDSEFDVWPRLKELYFANDFGQYADADGTLHTCFTTNNDITGGNSGSPVINANGELIGIAFDGNWEAMSGDIAFETELQKCINVDIRFVLWVIDRFAGATNLIDEMTLVK